MKINKWYKYQKRIIIAKKIDIHTARFELKENEKIYRYNSVGQVSIVVERIAIFKQKMRIAKKHTKKLLIYLLLAPGY